MIHDPVPLCIDCHKRMTCLRNGIIVMRVYSDGKPYEFQGADMYQCDKCGRRHVSGFSSGSVRPEHIDSFNQMLERYEAQEPEFKIWWQ